MKKLWSTRVGKPKAPHLVQSGPTEQGVQQPKCDDLGVTQESHHDDQSAEFSGEPFVKAAAIFRMGKTEGVIDLLTEAVENGK